MTTECNLQCRYCFGEATDDVDADFPDFEIDYHLPRSIGYDLKSLDRFCRQDPNCVLTFYGGEPLLRIDDIKHIMDNVRAERFLIQTNGLLLDRLDTKHVNRFHTILVSVDGDEALTDFYRGKGTFRKVIDNLKLIKQNGFKGELIARMTVMEHADIDEQVKWLLKNDEFPFSSVHWQLNAGFWKNDFHRRRFEEWSDKDYNRGIRNLVKFWVDQMEKSGLVLRLYPFLGVARSLLYGERDSLLRCGGGWINYAIQTDGYVVPCPTLWGMKDYYLGHVGDANPLRLEKVFVGEPCTNCDIYGICGGRCLYANITKRWGTHAYNLICNTVRNLIDAVAGELPRMKRLIDSQRISFEDFEFMKFNGCEIIP